MVATNMAPNSQGKKRPNSNEGNSKRKAIKPEPNQTPEPTPAPKDKLVIALDFGTTFSGIAYCFMGQRDPTVVAVSNWPGAEGQATPKIPTVIAYTNSAKEFQWGALANQEDGNIVAVKLLLDPSQERPMYLPSINHKRMLKNLPKPPLHIAIDFIGAMYRHAISEISKTVQKEYFDACEKEFVVTVPAIWSDQAKDVTRRAAEAAVISPVNMIKEPEAAALYTFRSLDVGLKKGDTFVLCDAGGGTVDLITYEVAESSPSLKLKEIVPGTGGMSGSLGLNQRFGEAVRDLVGDGEFASLQKTKGYNLAVNNFDREVKKSFRGNEGEEYFVNFPMTTLPDDEEAGLQNSCWRVTGKDLNMIFAPLVTDIVRLVEDQIKSARLKRAENRSMGIFLVGGFGSSQFLKSKLEKNFPGIQVIQPTDAWAAVVKGAVLSRFPNSVTVTSTCATRHYGFQLWSKFDAEIDKGVDPYVDIDGIEWAERMKWPIKIGDTIHRDDRFTFTAFRTLGENYELSDLVWTEQLDECSDRQPPVHFQNGHNIGINCQLKCDIQAIPKERLKLQRNINEDGEIFYKLYFDLVIELKSAVMTFSVEIDGEKIASVEAEYE